MEGKNNKQNKGTQGVEIRKYVELRTDLVMQTLWHNKKEEPAYVLKKVLRGHKDGTVVKSACWSFRSPEFSSQHPQWTGNNYQ